MYRVYICLSVCIASMYVCTYGIEFSVYVLDISTYAFKLGRQAGRQVCM